MGPKSIAAVVLVAVFALGAVSGFLVHGHLRVAGHGMFLAPASGAELHEQAMGELREALQLTDEQEKAIEAIVGRRQELVQHMWEQLRPEVQEAMTAVHEEIAALLTPEQRVRFHEWLQKQRQSGETPVH